MSAAPLLYVAGVWKHFGATPVLRGIDLDVPPATIVALLGPSGCGKSTLLRIITGLEQPDTGQVRFAGRDLHNVPVHRRGFGLMFQDWALFPHRNVAENIGFGLRMQGASKAQRTQRVAEMLALVGLEGHAQRTIFELSGGEQQRVALARALAPQPHLLLLDEPLGSLDRTLRERLAMELRQIIRAAGVAAVYVTHDQIEAFTVADRLVVMQAGTVAQVGTPREIYQQPASPFVARFLSLNNLLPCTITAPVGALVQAQTPLGPLLVAPPELPAAACVLIRPEAALMATAHGINQRTGLIVDVVFRGDTVRIAWKHASGVALELDAAPDQPWKIGQSWSIQLAPQALSLLPAG